MTEEPKKLPPAFSIEITDPSGTTTVIHDEFTVQGDYGGTSDPDVLIEVKLIYVNPTGNDFASGKLVPEDPSNQGYTRTFNNVDPTQASQRGLLTAFLYDSTG